MTEGGTGPNGSGGAGPEYPATHAWTTDAALQVQVGLLPQFLQVWAWHPLFAPCFWIGSLATLVAVICGAWVLGRSATVLSSAGIRKTGIGGYRISWDAVKAVRAATFCGIPWPALHVVLKHPIPSLPLMPLRDRVLLDAPRIPTTTLCRIVEAFVGPERMDPGLRDRARTRMPRWRHAAIVLVHLPMALLWPAAILWIWRGMPAGVWKLALWGPWACLAMGLLRQTLWLSLRWHEPDGFDRAVLNPLTFGSLPLLIVLIIPVRCDLTFVLVILAAFWALTTLEVYGLLAAARRLVKGVSPLWAFVVLGGYGIFPGRDVLWHLRHVRGIDVGMSQSDAAGEADVSLPQHAAWPDGRQAVFEPIPDGRGLARLSFISKDLQVVARAIVPDGCAPSVHGDWLIWASTDREERRWCHYQLFGSGDPCGSLEGLAVIDAVPDLPPSNTAFARSRSDSEIATLWRVDLVTGAAMHLVQAAGVVAAAQTGSETVSWARRDGDDLTIEEWSPGVGVRTTFRVADTGAESSTAIPSSDFGHVLVTGATGEAARVVRLRDGLTWALPAGVRLAAEDWHMPYLICRDGSGRASTLLKLREDGSWVEVPGIPGGPGICAATISPEQTVMVLLEEAALFRRAHVLVDLRSGKQRRLLVDQGLAYWNPRPGRTQWSGSTFSYVLPPMLRPSDRLRLVVIDAGCGF